MVSSEVSKQFQAVTSAGGTFFRSCFVEREKYCIGDFVVIQKRYETADNARVMRIEACCDRGSKHIAGRRVVLFTTRFLRKGDIPRLKQDDRELIMDKRKAAGSEMCLAADIKYACQVVHSDDLDSKDKTSFFYHSAYDGKRVSRLKMEETQSSFSYHLRKKKTSQSASDEENHSPVPERKKVNVSTPAVLKLKPLRDIALTTNDTASQSDDLDEIINENRAQTVRRRQKAQGKTYLDSSELEVCNSRMSSQQGFTRLVHKSSDNLTKSASRLRSSSSVNTSAERSSLKSTKRRAAKNLIESVNYDDEAAGKQLKDSPAKTKDPYEFNSDGTPSPSKQVKRSTMRSRRRTTGQQLELKSSTSISQRSSTSRKLSKVKDSEGLVRQLTFTRTTRYRADLDNTSISSTDSLSNKQSQTPEDIVRRQPRVCIESVSPPDSAILKEKKTPKRNTTLRGKPATREEKKKAVSPTPDETAESASRSSLKQKHAAKCEVSQPNKTRTRKLCQDISLLDSNSSGESDVEAQQRDVPMKRPAARRSGRRVSRLDIGHSLESESDEPEHTKSATSQSKGASCRRVVKDDNKPQSLSSRTRAKSTSEETSAQVQSSSSRRLSSRCSNKISNYSETEEASRLSDESEDGAPAIKQSRHAARREQNKRVKETEVAVNRNRRNREVSSTVEASKEPQPGSTRQILSRSAKKVKSYNVDTALSDSDLDEAYNPDKDLTEQSDSSTDSGDTELDTKQSKRSTRGVSARRGSEIKRQGVMPRGRRSTAMFTPSVKDRHRPVKQSGTVLERARAQLHVSVVPDSLPCREEEFANILGYVEGKLESGTGGCLYISGVPGTGKTATVFEVMRHLKYNQSKDSSLPKFKFISINGMRLTQPHQAFVQIYKSLTEKKVTADHATSLLDAMFCKARRQESIVLLVDELDLLMTRKQDVLYNLFDWPTKPRSKLIVLAIANTMDLPERVMMNRVSSRLGLNRMTFQPYTFQQLQEIVFSRLTGISAFDPDAVQLASRKVAAVSGDARRALDICRRSTEVAENEEMQLVSMQHVDRALQEMFSSPKITAIRNCSFYEKIVLKAILAEFTRSGLEEATLYQVYRHIDALCAMDRMPCIKMIQMMKICTKLNNIKLLLLECNGKAIYQRVRLNVGQDDVQYALRDN